MPSNIPTAAQFAACDALNVERLTDQQAINQLEVQNETTEQQVVSDGATATQDVLADLAERQRTGIAVVETSSGCNPRRDRGPWPILESPTGPPVDLVPALRPCYDKRKTSLSSRRGVCTPWS